MCPKYIFQSAQDLPENQAVPEQLAHDRQQIGGPSEVQSNISS